MRSPLTFVTYMFLLCRAVATKMCQLRPHGQMMRPAGPDNAARGNGRGGDSGYEKTMPIPTPAPQLHSIHTFHRGDEEICRIGFAIFGNLLNGPPG
jgi:hypothetical protein